MKRHFLGFEGSGQGFWRVWWRRGVLAVVLAGQVTPEVQAGQVTGEVQAGQPAPEAQAGQAIGQVQEGQVTEEVQAGQVTPEAQAGQAIGQVQEGQVTGQVQEGQVTGQVQAGQVTGEVQAGQVTGEVQAGQATGQVQAGQVTGQVQAGQATPTEQAGQVTGQVQAGQVTGQVQAGQPAPDFGFWSVVPPLLAILLALLLKEVYLSLLLAVLGGAWILAGHQYGWAEGLGRGMIDLINRDVLNALYNREHLSVVVFSMLIGGMVSLLSRNGGMQGVVQVLSRWAKDARSGQWVTWLLGIVVFFDDYANTLLVGNTMRPVTDRLKISRAKLAYLVDATAAPVASVAFISTWIGAELGYIQGGLDRIGTWDVSAYQVFLASVPYSFYSWFTIAFMAILIYRQRDFGPMWVSERKARQQASSDAGNGVSVGGVETFDMGKENEAFAMKAGLSPHPWMAVLPVLTVIAGVIAGLLATGWDSVVWAQSEQSWWLRLSAIIGKADSFKALLMGSFGGCVVAMAMTLGSSRLSLQEAVDAVLHGFKIMLPATLILVLAWALASLTEQLHTAEYISQNLVALNWSSRFLPAMAFVMAGLVAFSTGTSWGTMAILYPLLLPAGWEMIGADGLAGEEGKMIFYQLVSSVLAGAVLGDHCSPISDTTIMSSLSSSCNHLEHVRTQMPYAVVVGIVSLLAGSIPAAFGLSLWIVYPCALALIWVLVGILGRRSDIP